MARSSIVLSPHLVRPLLAGETIELIVEGRRFPYGQPGHRMWVREIWAHAMPSLREYLADYHDGNPQRVDIPWRSPLNMRREHSRLVVELVSVRGAQPDWTIKLRKASVST